MKKTEEPDRKAKKHAAEPKVKFLRFKRNIGTRGLGCLDCHIIKHRARRLEVRMPNIIKGVNHPNSWPFPTLNRNRLNEAAKRPEPIQSNLERFFCNDWTSLRFGISSSPKIMDIIPRGTEPKIIHFHVN